MLSPTKEEALQSIRNGTYSETYLKSLLSDIDFLEEAMKIDIEFLKYTPHELRNDKQYIAKLVSSVPSALLFASDSIRKDKEFALALIEENEDVLDYVKKEFFTDTDFVKKTINNRFKFRFIIPDEYKYLYIFDESDGIKINYPEIYARTRFTVFADEEINFDYLTIPTDVPFNKPFSIVTAWNPMDMKVTIGGNIERNKALQDILYVRNHQFDTAKGYLSEHFEISFCIYDISFEEAIELGEHFNQYSIFYFDGTIAGYYNTETKKTILVSAQEE